MSRCFPLTNSHGFAELALVCAALVGAAGGCAGDEPADDTSKSSAEACEKGDEGCACYENKTCNEGLSCLSKHCVDEDEAGAQGNDDDEKPGTKPGANDPDGEGGVEPSHPGSENGSGSSDTEADPNDPGEDDPSNPDSTEPGSTEPGSASSPSDTDSSSAPSPDDTSDPDDTSTNAPEPGECAAPSTLQMSETGVVDASCNDAEIRGVWYCFDDGINATSCEEDIAPHRAGEMCLSGVTTEDEEFLAWGAGLGLTFNQLPEQTSEAYNAASHGVIGMRLTIAGDVGGNSLRVAFKSTQSGTAPFVEVPGTGTFEVYISSAEVPSEWSIPEAGSKPDATSLFYLQITIVGGESDSSYDFCVSDVQPMFDPDAPAPTDPDPPSGDGPVRGGGASGPDAVENEQYAGPIAHDAPLADDELGESLDGVDCNEETESVAWCTSDTRIVYCSAEEWWAVDCPALGAEAYCGYSAAEHIVDCVPPAAPTVPTCETEADCDPGQACVTFDCTEESCDYVCSNICTWSGVIGSNPAGVDYDDCRATASEPYECWGKSGDSVCMLSCEVDNDCPSGQVCTLHADIPEGGSDFNTATARFCRDACKTDADCAPAMYTSANFSSAGCSCVSDGLCILDPNDAEAGFECSFNDAP